MADPAEVGDSVAAMSTQRQWLFGPDDTAGCEFRDALRTLASEERDHAEDLLAADNVSGALDCYGYARTCTSLAEGIDV